MILRKKIILVVSVLITGFIFIAQLAVKNSSVPAMTEIKKNDQSNVELLSNHVVDEHFVLTGDDVLLFSNLLGGSNSGLSKDNLPEYLVRWIKENPKEVMNKIFEIDDAQFQTHILSLAVKVWYEEDKDAFQDWFTQVEINNALTNLCTVDGFAPQTCIQYGERIEELEKQTAIIAFQLKAWVDSDIQSAVSWSVKGDETYQRFGIEVYQYLIEVDFYTALSSLSLLVNQDLPTSEKIVDLIISKIYQDIDNGTLDSSIISNTLLSLPIVNSEFKEMLFASLAPVALQAGQNYNNIAFIEALPEGPERESLEHGLVNQLVYKDVDEALNYLDSVPNEEKQRLLTTTLVESWGEHDFLAANDWVEKNETVPAEAVLTLARVGLNQENLNIADGLIERVRNTPGNTQKTIDLQLRLAQLIYQEYPEAATIYINGMSEISKEEQKSLLEFIVNDGV